MKPLRRISSVIVTGVLVGALFVSACASSESNGTRTPEGDPSPADPSPANPPMPDPPRVDPPTPEPSAIDDARNVPAGGRVAFYIGQETRTLRELREEVYLASNVLPPPDGVTLYTGIGAANLVPNTAPDDATLYVSGIEGPPINNENGEVDFAATLEEYDALGETVGLAVGLYLSDGWVRRKL